MPPPVLTFTANPLAETTLEFAEPVRRGATQRARRASFQVGGKGFNVAKMLHRLGGPVTAWSFAGGTSGDACRRWLTVHAAYPWELIPMRAPTREGVVAREPDGTETTLLGPDCVLDAEAVLTAARCLTAAASGSVIALCGSLPGWADPVFAPLRQFLLEQAPATRLVVDTYGPALADLVQRPVALVKINRQEFTALAKQLHRPPQLATVATALPVRAWIVTDGGNAIEYHTKIGRAHV